MPTNEREGKERDGNAEYLRYNKAREKRMRKRLRNLQAAQKGAFQIALLGKN